MTDEAVTQVQPHDDVLLIAILKRTLDRDSTQTLVDDVESAAAERPRVPIVLDMSSVKFAPSVALGALVHLSKSFKLENRRIALFGLDHRVKDAIRVTMLHEVIEVHATLEQACRALPS